MGPPLLHIAPDAPLPPISIDAGQERLAPDARSFSADGNVIVTGGREFLLKADHIAGDLSSGVTQADGHLYLRELGTTITGTSAHFNLTDDTGLFTDATVNQSAVTITANHITLYPNRALAFGASFSTCPPGMGQDYHIQARTLVYNEVTERLTAIGASIYLGRTRLAYVPYLSFQLGTQNRQRTLTQTVRQQVGYNRFDGPYVGFTARPPLLKQPISISVILPLHSTIEATATTTIPLLTPHRRSGPSAPRTPIALVRQFAESRSRLLPDGDPLLYHNFGVPSVFDRLLTQYGGSPTAYTTATVAYHDRIFGKSSIDLLLSRLPEVSFPTYIPLIGHQDLPHDQDPTDVRRALRQSAVRLYITPEFGYYHEYPTGVHHSRQAISANIEARPLLIGPNTFFYPRIGVQDNTYSDGFSYHYFQFDLGLQRYINDRTAFGVEYIKSQVRGHSPFLWDTLDTSQELDIRGQVGTNKHIVSVLLRYDLNRGDLFTWDLTYGKVLRCLVPTINYDGRSHNIGFGLNVQGLTF